MVCTEEVEIHPTSDLTPYIEGRLWDDRDIPAHARIAAAIHAGAASPSGGVVTVRLEPGRPAYRGSTRNGVVSGDFGSYPASFRFER